MPSRRAATASGTDVSVTPDDVLERAELAQPDRPARVELLRRVADLGAEPELAAVGEARRGVHVDARGVDPELEGPRARVGRRHDRLRMAGAVAVDVVDGLLDGVHNPDREDQRQEL